MDRVGPGHVEDVEDPGDRARHTPVGIVLWGESQTPAVRGTLAGWARAGLRSRAHRPRCGAGMPDRALELSPPRAGADAETLACAWRGGGLPDRGGQIAGSVRGWYRVTRSTSEGARKPVSRCGGHEARGGGPHRERHRIGPARRARPEGGWRDPPPDRIFSVRKIQPESSCNPKFFYPTEFTRNRLTQLGALNAIGPPFTAPQFRPISTFGNPHLAQRTRGAHILLRAYEQPPILAAGQ